MNRKSSCKIRNIQSKSDLASPSLTPSLPSAPSSHLSLSLPLPLPLPLPFNHPTCSLHSYYICPQGARLRHGSLKLNSITISRSKSIPSKTQRGIFAEVFPMWSSSRSRSSWFIRILAKRSNRGSACCLCWCCCDCCCCCDR